MYICSYFELDGIRFWYEVDGEEETLFIRKHTYDGSVGQIAGDLDC